MSEVRFRPMPGKVVAKIRTPEHSSLVLLSDPNNSRVAEVVAVYEPFNYHVDRPEDLTEAYVKVGDLVIFGRHGGTEITVNRERLVVLKESEILTILESVDGTENV